MFKNIFDKNFSGFVGKRLVWMTDKPSASSESQNDNSKENKDKKDVLEKQAQKKALEILDSPKKDLFEVTVNTKSNITFVVDQMAELLVGPEGMSDEDKLRSPVIEKLKAELSKSLNSHTKQLEADFKAGKITKASLKPLIKEGNKTDLEWKFFNRSNKEVPIAQPNPPKITQQSITDTLKKSKTKKTQTTSRNRRRNLLI